MVSGIDDRMTMGGCNAAIYKGCAPPHSHSTLTLNFVLKRALARRARDARVTLILTSLSIMSAIGRTAIWMAACERACACGRVRACTRPRAFVPAGSNFNCPFIYPRGAPGRNDFPAISPIGFAGTEHVLSVFACLVSRVACRPTCWHSQLTLIDDLT